MRREGALIGPCTASHDAAERRIPVENPGSEIVAPMAKLPGQETLINEYLAYRLAQANREINRQLESRLAGEGVPVEQWRILKVLSDGNGRSMGELAEAVLLNRPTLTKIIDGMLLEALVYRASDPKDRRKVLMFCAERGKILRQRLDLLAMSQEAHIVQRCGSRSVSELKRLLELLINSTN
jgi:MarR family transcriptional regulator, organic hydroperoxide resistance regulator